MLRKSLLALCALLATGPGATAHGEMIDVGGYWLNFDVMPGRQERPPIVLESGGGDDLGVWDNVVRPIQAATGSTVIRYDRAGLGKSQAAQFDYSIDSEARALARGLNALHVHSCVLLVAHSYGGFVAQDFAALYPSRVCGMVLVDADLAAFLTDSELKRIMAEYDSERSAVLKKSPGLARALDAFPATVTRMRTVDLPHGLPLIDVVADHDPAPPAPPDPIGSPADIRFWKEVQAQFVTQDPARSSVTASHSGHFVMHDRPDVVVQAVTSLYNRIAGEPANPLRTSR